MIDFYLLNFENISFVEGYFFRNLSALVVGWYLSRYNMAFL